MRHGRVSRRWRLGWTTGLGLALVSVGASSAAGAADDGRESDGKGTPGAEEIRADVRLLSAPELAGRGALTAGLDQAARFIAARFAALGLLPAGDGGTFFQSVDIAVPAHPSPATGLALGDERLVLGVDFVPNSGSAATRASGPLAVARCDATGAGAVPPGARDDFSDVDLRGKVVLCLLSNPGSTSRLLEKAVARGAIGVLFVETGETGESGETGSTPDGAGMIEPLPAFTLDQTSAIASFHVRQAAIDRLLAPSRLTVAGLQSALAPGRLSATDLSRLLSRTGWATFAVVWAPPSVKGRNVIGRLRGSDPGKEREVVVVGAHYDHLGWGDEGGALDGRRIHPGADDNASGTAAMMAVAAMLVGATPRPRRSILFVAFTGEEKGWAGSRVAAARPPWPVVAMLNLDMVGRMKRNALEVNGSATSPDWWAIVETAKLDAGDGLTLSYPRAVPSGSDHQPFIVKKIPALFLFTGLHCDYHRGSDSWDKVNAEGVLGVARLTSAIARLVADRARRLTFAAPTWAERRPPFECAP